MRQSTVIYIIILKMNKFIILISMFFTFAFAFGQDRFENYKKYEIKHIPKTSIEISAPKDSVISYFIKYDKDNVVKISDSVFQKFDSNQAFITKKTYNEFVKKGVSSDQLLYSEETSLASLWDITFKSFGEGKTIIEFEIKSVLTDDKIVDNINGNVINQDELWKMFYQNEKLVSRGIIESLYQIYFKKSMKLENPN